MAQNQEIINIELKILDQFSTKLNEANKLFAQLNSVQVQAQKNSDKAGAAKMAAAKIDVEVGRKHLRAIKEENQLQIQKIRLQ